MKRISIKPSWNRAVRWWWRRRYVVLNWRRSWFVVLTSWPSEFIFSCLQYQISGFDFHNSLVKICQVTSPFLLRHCSAMVRASLENVNYGNECDCYFILQNVGFLSHSAASFLVLNKLIRYRIELYNNSVLWIEIIWSHFASVHIPGDDLSFILSFIFFWSKP